MVWACSGKAKQRGRVEHIYSAGVAAYIAGTPAVLSTFETAYPGYQSYLASGGASLQAVGVLIEPLSESTVVNLEPFLVMSIDL